MRAVTTLVVALALSGCVTSVDGSPPALGAIMSPVCLFNCMTVIHYTIGAPATPLVLPKR